MSEPDGHRVVAVAEGGYEIHQAARDVYVVYGPDLKVDGEWLQASLPAGDWVTEWISLSPTHETMIVTRA